jgi:folate-dependent tRNA-U54 methylase TrmFO/GidA
MLYRTKMKMAQSGLSGLIFINLVVSALGGTEKQAQMERDRVRDQLREFKSAAFALVRETDTFHCLIPSKNLSFESHTYRLNELRYRVNQLGKLLTKLEAETSVATEGQAMAIEQARPDLVSVAQNLTQAIALANQNYHNVNSMDYAEAVGNIYAHANALYSNMDSILDYAEAEMRPKPQP